MGTVTTLTHEEAWELASQILSLLKSKGKQANFCVYNRQCRLLLHVCMDDPRVSTAEIARLKAYQACICGRRTRTIVEAVREGKYTPEIFGIKREEFVPFPGGVPIYSVEKKLLGAIGMSGLSAEEDESICVEAVELIGLLSDE